MGQIFAFLHVSACILLYLVVSWVFVFLSRLMSWAGCGIPFLASTVRIFHECEVWIEKSVRGSLFDITRLCRVMPNSDFSIRSEQPWSILFLAYLSISSVWFSRRSRHERIILLYVDVRHIESWGSVWRHNDVNFNVLATELGDLLYNQCINNTCCYSFLSVQRVVWVRVCKIRFVSTGENQG